MEKGIVRKLVEQILIFIIMQVITAFIISLLTLESGRLFISKSYINSSSDFNTMIELKNYNENKPINNVKILFDSSVNVIELELLSKNISSSNGTVEISYLPPRTTETIIVHSSLPMNESDVILDTSDKIVVRGSEGEKPDLFFYYVYIGVNIVLYSIMSIIIAIGNKKWREEIKKEREKLEKNISELEKTSDENKKELKSVKALITKVRILYISRISDYRKELEFWKNTVRKMMYKVVDKQEIEKLFTDVTESLQTYGTKSKIEFYSDELLHIAEKLAEKEKVQPTDIFLE